MTREEIKEGLGRHIGLGIVRDVPLDEIVESVLSYLDNNGVVIKVDENRLPDISYHSAYPENEDNYQKAMLKAGYVAVESLI